VVEHRDAIAGEPDVALQAGSPQPQTEGEGLDRVLLRMGTGASVGEADGRIEERREPLLHPGHGTGGALDISPSRPLRRLRAVFNVTGGELVIILLVALIVLGPDKLPDAIRKVGRVYGELRRMSTGFQSEIRDALDEPMREVRDTMNTMKGGFMGGDDPPPGTRMTAPSNGGPGNGGPGTDGGTATATAEPEPATPETTPVQPNSRNARQPVEIIVSVWHGWIDQDVETGRSRLSTKLARQIIGVARDAGEVILN